ncbi:SDR family oxidoreductase [Brasilonema sp. UFV-L1]|uniref:SDR family oxidoreductase n=1 Tax=Brasilonema sp. UFV-L1 TaxID=2234130 RepID=UPI00145F7899|nr:SDR family oxidoreductase [Brasilonema sp. UFV-L1]NMG10317.1 SDR family NAD(P)-dependent oxidoreductase [Brasilonema sp. UFV-L1]
MILVTGATGTNGYEILKQLSTTDAQVRAFVRNPKKALMLKELGVEVVIGDFNEPETLNAALKDVEKALLLSTPDLQQVKLQSNFIKAAKHSGIRHIVKFSALGANLNAPAAILKWHGQTEKQLEETGISFTHLRPNVFMQNILRVAQTIATQRIFSDRVGDAKFSLVDVRDIAAVAVKVLTEEGHEGKVYSITGPEVLSFGEVAEKLSIAIEEKVTYVSVSPEEYKKRRLETGVQEWFVDAVNEIYSYYSEGMGMIVTNVVAEVARKQPISFDQFAKDYAQSFKKS